MLYHPLDAGSGTDRHNVNDRLTAIQALFAVNEVNVSGFLSLSRLQALICRQLETHLAGQIVP